MESAETSEKPAYEGHDVEKVWAVGDTPEAAVRALCERRFGAYLSGDLRPLDFEAPFDWAGRFTCDGTYFKAGGINVPGGVVLTWWK